MSRISLLQIQKHPQSMSHQPQTIVRQYCRPLQSTPWLENRQQAVYAKRIAGAAAVGGVGSLIALGNHAAEPAIWAVILLTCVGVCAVAACRSMLDPAIRAWEQTCPKCLQRMSRGATKCPQCHYEPVREVLA